MDVHNLMEDVVIKCLNEILDLKSDVCKCEQCKLDMVCYILNKTKPMYVVSSRGIIHSQNERRENNQADIDIYSLVKEAIDIISRTPRHTYEKIDQETKFAPRLSDDKFIFIFPAIVGRVMDSTTFDPASGIEVYIYQGNSDTPLSMYNNRWTNPVELVKAMDGTFTFWPCPQKADKPGIQKVFQMNIEIRKDKVTSMRKFFEITLVSTINQSGVNPGDRLYRLDDIYLTPED